MARMGRRKTRLLAITALAGLVCLVLGQAVAAPVANDNLDKIQVGMTRAQVERTLGKPDRDVPVQDEPGLCRLYTYRKLGGYKLVNIWFDCEDKVETIDKIR